MILWVGVAFGVLWLGWLISWWVASLWASSAAKRPPVREEIAYRALTVVGAILMFVQFRDHKDWGLLWFNPIWVDWLLLVVAVAGIAFAWWARIHLGTLWSARVTRKEDHKIVDTGPYGIVRHPIYTGILIAIYATVLAFPGVLNGLGAVVLTISFVVKYRLEERFLSQELRAEAYEGYRRRVPALVPLWPAGR